MKKHFLCMTMLLPILFFSCQSSDGPLTKEDTGKVDPIELVFTEKLEKDNLFSFDLFKKTIQYSGNENIFISPLSVNLALNMVLNGAEGQTKMEMLEALRAKGYSLDDVNAYSKQLCADIMPEDKSIQLNIANSIWYHNEFQVNDLFVETNKSYYNAEVTALDFTSPDAVTQINDWCARQTNNKIKNVLNAVSPADLMYLANAVYFKGNWELSFYKEFTVKKNFFQANGVVKMVDMMNQIDYFNFAEDENGRYLELPYATDFMISAYSTDIQSTKRSLYSMVVMLPQEGKSLNELTQSLNNESWKQINESWYKKRIALELPRFNFKGDYLLEKDILPALGMKLPFTLKADFSRIMKTEELFYISSVIHKSFIDVNEHGTEAAAVTIIGGAGSSGEEPKPPKPIDYVVNQPFLFAIHEKTSGAILFIGKVGEFE